MKPFVAIALLGLATLAVLLTALLLPAPTADARVGTIGPDVIVGVLPATRLWGSVGGITAYSVATTSCNVGDETLPWIASNNQHPVIAQNLYRLKDDRMEQIGMSWLKHGFTALAQNACGLGCQNPGTGSLLGVGCSDPYSASLNGDQDGFGNGGLGPRFEVNATTGDFNYPYTFQGQSGDAIYKRLQVPTDDVTPALNVGARYFIEGHYVTSADALIGNGLNNASYREVILDSDLTLDVTGATQQTRPAILAWAAIDPTVDIAQKEVPDDGLFTLATKVIDLGDGNWRYEYAVHNLNSHRSGQAFTVFFPPGVQLSNVGFKDVDYHSGEPYSLDDWTVSIDPVAGLITWSTDTFATDQNANALRWGTMYNFWFDADGPPSMTQSAVSLFRPGAPTGIFLPTQGPTPNPLFADGFESGNTSAWDEVMN